VANLVDVIVDHFPPVSGVAIPLGSQITIEFDVEMDPQSLEDNFFVEGPDTDQFVGEGLTMLVDPDNVSQGDFDDFLRSPGYQGIVQGTTEVDVVSGVGTTLTFTPTQPLHPNINYVVNISDPEDALGDTVSGYVTWGFQTGTGSIEELPSTISTSVLAVAPHISDYATAQGPLQVVKTTPADHAIEQETTLEEIEVEFNKDLDPASITDDSVEVETIVATDHPEAGATAVGRVVKSLEVDGKVLKIKI
jgi:hypothetical protein